MTLEADKYVIFESIDYIEINIVTTNCYTCNNSLITMVYELIMRYKNCLPARVSLHGTAN